MTPHIEANQGEIAKTVIMPGDPKRAKLIADTYLENTKIVSDIRGIAIYTGTYEGKPVTVMASGMGMASLGIYATELFKIYDVDNIIRIGTCGALKENIKIGDVLLAKDSYTTSNFAHTLTGINQNLIESSEELNKKIKDIAKTIDINLKEVRINTSDIFYTEYQDESIKKNNCVAVEMETFALLFLAKHFKKQATAILTVSDSILSKEQLTPEEREKNLKTAIILGLKTL